MRSVRCSKTQPRPGNSTIYAKRRSANTNATNCVNLAPSKEPTSKSLIFEVQAPRAHHRPQLYSSSCGAGYFSVPSFFSYHIKILRSPFTRTAHNNSRPERSRPVRLRDVHLVRLDHPTELSVVQSSVNRFTV